MNETERDRVDIKQQAVLDALRLGERLSNILKNRIKDKDHGMGTKDLAEWETQFCKCEKDGLGMLSIININFRCRQRIL